MSNAHRNTVLYDEARVRREQRVVARQRAQQRKLERLQKKFDRRAGR